MVTKHRQLADRFAFAHELQSARSERHLLHLTQAEIERTTGYRHAWLYLLTPDRENFELIEVVSVAEASLNRHAAILPVAGDRMLQEIASGKEPVVVLDARTDPRTDQEIVKNIGCITLINIPIRLPDYPLGGLGTGTFEGEGVRPPSSEVVLTLVDIADQVAIALARIRNQAQALAATREQERLLAQLAELKRQESLGTLAAGLLQEMNQLIDMSLGCLAVVHEEGLTQRQLLDLSNLQRTLDRMASVTRPLARFGQRYPAEQLDVNLNERIREILLVVQRLLGLEVELDTELQHDLPLVLGDVAMLDQVLLNLVLAARAGLPNGGRMHVRTRSAGGRVFLQIGYHGSACKAPSELGSDLDLTLCRHILRRHEGSLEVEASSQGNCFLMQVPARS